MPGQGTYELKYVSIVSRNEKLYFRSVAIPACTCFSNDDMTVVISKLRIVCQVSTRAWKVHTISLPELWSCVLRRKWWAKHVQTPNCSSTCKVYHFMIGCDRFKDRVMAIVVSHALSMSCNCLILHDNLPQKHVCKQPWKCVATNIWPEFTLCLFRMSWGLASCLSAADRYNI